MEKNIWDNEVLIDVLREGGVVVMPTDTIYGITGQALNSGTVERIYNIKQRENEKPCIVLIGEIADLKKFNIEFSPAQEKFLKKYWSFSGTEEIVSTSIIFDCENEKLRYLHRGTNTLAFRLPKKGGLVDLIKKVGPLIAPSANPEGEKTAQNIDEAKDYFEGLPDLYIDGGEMKGKASRVIKLGKDGSINIIRE